MGIEEITRPDIGREIEVRECPIRIIPSAVDL
jgi:hypothetical protein